MGNEQLAWAAGLFEGEGCFSTRHCGSDRSLVARLKMTDEDVVRRFFEIVQVGNVTGPYTKVGRKPVWIWQTGSFEGVQFTVAIFWKWLHARRRHRAKELLEFFHFRQGAL